MPGFRFSFFKKLGSLSCTVYLEIANPSCAIVRVISFERQEMTFSGVFLVLDQLWLCNCRLHCCVNIESFGSSMQCDL